MTGTPNEDKPGFVAEEPEHCSVCFRLIRPGQTYYLTIEHEVLCADCALDEGVIRVRDALMFMVEDRRLLFQVVLAEYSHPPGFWPARTLLGSTPDRWETEKP